MGFLVKLFGKRKPVSHDIAFSRGPKAIDAKTGTEDATFAREASVVLGCEASTMDLTKDIQAEYGCDELEVVELVQIAEDIWSVSLMPNPFQAEDAERAVRKFRTLRDIIDAAKSKTDVH